GGLITPAFRSIENAVTPHAPRRRRGPGPSAAPFGPPRLVRPHPAVPAPPCRPGAGGRRRLCPAPGGRGGLGGGGWAGLAPDRLLAPPSAAGRPSDAVGLRRCRPRAGEGPGERADGRAHAPAADGQHGRGGPRRPGGGQRPAAGPPRRAGPRRGEAAPEALPPR